MHCSPFRIEAVGDALGARTFDVVYAMYGRLRQLAPFFVGRCGRFIAVGGVPAYRGFAMPQDLRPAGMLTPIREDAPRAVDDPNVKVAAHRGRPRTCCSTRTPRPRSSATR